MTKNRVSYVFRLSEKLKLKYTSQRYFVLLYTSRKMDALVSELRKRFAESGINHITLVEPRCIRVEYSSPSILRWLEIWSAETGGYKILRSEKIYSVLKVTRAGVLEYMNERFVVPDV